METDNESEYEDWLPTVIKKWDKLVMDTNRNGKKYTAFLRFVFKSYYISARVLIRWRKNNNNNKHLALLVYYDGYTRTMNSMREQFQEIRDIIYAFDPMKCRVEYDTSIKYNNVQIWERNAWNGPTYFRDLVCIGKGVVPYMPREIRNLICH